MACKILLVAQRKAKRSEAKHRWTSFEDSCEFKSRAFSDQGQLLAGWPKSRFFVNLGGIRHEERPNAS